MLRMLASRAVKKFGATYEYDTSYMEHILKISPAGFFKFSKLNALATHNENTPIDALFAAKLVGAVAEDCGPCVQLVVNMAREAGMSSAEISAVLQRDEATMNEATQMGFRFAEAVVRKALELDEVRDQIRAAWGDKGVIDLTFAVQIGRVFPMLKVGLGYAKTCQRISVNATLIEVQKVAP